MKKIERKKLVCLIRRRHVGGGWLAFNLILLFERKNHRKSKHLPKPFETFAGIVYKHPKTFIKGEKFAMAEKRNGNVICD